MACFSCGLLYEVADPDGDIPCPGCARQLEHHQPSRVYAMEQTGSLDELRADADEAPDERSRTVLLGELDKAADALQEMSGLAPRGRSGAVPPVKRRSLPEAPPPPEDVEVPTQLFAPAPAPADRPSKPRRTNPPPRVEPPPPPMEAADDAPTGPFRGRPEAAPADDPLAELLAEPSLARSQAAPVAPPVRAPRRRGRRSAGSLLGVVVTVVIGGGIAAMMVLKGRGPVAPQGVAELAPVGGAEAPTETAGELETVVDTVAETLPTAPHVDPLADRAWLAAGPEALRTSAGLVPGLASGWPTPASLQRDEGGEWVPAARRLLERASEPGGAPLALAFDGSIPASSVLRFAYSGHKAGFDRFSLVVRRVDRPERLAGIDFALELPSSTRPSAGVAVVRVGRLGVRLSVESRDGERLTAEDAVVPREQPGDIDAASLEDALRGVCAAHPAVRTAVVHVDPEMTVAQLVPLLVHLREAPDRDRFPSLRLARP